MCKGFFVGCNVDEIGAAAQRVAVEMKRFCSLLQVVTKQDLYQTSVGIVNVHIHIHTFEKLKFDREPFDGRIRINTQRRG